MNTNINTYEVQYDNDTIIFTQNCKCTNSKIVVHKVSECVVSNSITRVKVPIKVIYKLYCDNCKRECNYIEIK